MSERRVAEMTRPGDEEDAYVAALSALPGMGPANLVSILRNYDPRAAWQAVQAGTLERPNGRPESTAHASESCNERRPGAAWRLLTAKVDPPKWWRPFAARGIHVTWSGQPEFPEALVSDPSPPGAVFWRGRLEALRDPCVAVVGTRNATSCGIATAYELGRDLTAAGVCVVSGLAIGIDGAAHRGAVDATKAGAPSAPVAVVASGVDVVYPKRNAVLWEQVATSGAVVSETAPGRPAQAWRFPSRNRIIAGLARLVVVVESHARGGSLITVEAALARGVEVRAVPGAVRSAASEGTNQLLYEGAGLARDATDVLDSLGIFDSASSRRLRGSEALPLSILGRAVLDSMGWYPMTPNQLILSRQVSPAEALQALDELVERGAVVESAGLYTRVT